MKRLVLPSIVALAFLAATPTVFAAEAKQQLKELVESVKKKLATGKPTEELLAEDLKKFDAILEEHKGEKTDDVAQVLFMKALLYAEVLGNTDKAVELLKKLSTEFPETAVAKQADAATKSLVRQGEARKIQESLVVGAQFPDFEVKDLEGKPLSVSQFKGKVVMIDFWATWCGPCIQELPNLLKAYEKYHDKGFEIIGISLDTDQGKLTSFIKEKKMNWPHHFDGKGWEAELALKYGITGIPATYLLDGEGKIIAKGLRGDALETALAGALK
jgi:thiol-disulfide isomerase/thioredoxin